MGPVNRVLRFLASVSLVVPCMATAGVESKLLFSAPVPSPGAMTFCQDRLFVYSKESRSFLALDPADGKLLGKMPLGEGVAVTAATCFKGTLLVGLESKGGAISLEFLNWNERYEVTRETATAPALSRRKPARIADLSCREFLKGWKCFAVTEGRVFQSLNAREWRRIEVPSSAGIPNRGTDLEKNPFSDWQEKLQVTKGAYTRYLALGENRFALLDPFRPAVVVSAAEGKWARFGKWGIWEGHFYAPKAIAHLQFGDQSEALAISDPFLKSVFLFSIDGEFRGSLDSKSPSLRYPAQLLAAKNRLFVSDLMAGKVHAVAVKVSPVESGEDDREELLRPNYFRRPEVLADREALRCLLCHDGSIHDATERFVPGVVNHPIGKPQKLKTDLPLRQGRVDCVSCHDPHHGGSEKVSKRPPFLRESENQLCVSCHSDRKQDVLSHISPAKSPGKVRKGSKACLECHRSHGGFPQMLRSEFPQLCISCHTAEKFEHRSVKDLALTDGAKEVHLTNEQVSCRTCHSMHDHEKQGLLARRPPVTKFCASCHGAKTDVLYERFHERIPKTKNSK